MGRALVICADDFGMNEAVSQGIIALAGLGRLSATSAMVLAPQWPEQARALASCRTLLDVGLHLDWTSAFALAAGHGMPLGRLMLHSGLRRLDAQQVRREIDRQLDLFEVHWQAPPDHVDGHQHVQQFPVIREALMAALVARYGRVGRRPWLRVSAPLAPGFDAKARVIAAMGAGALARLADQAQWPHSRHLSGIYDFDGNAQAYGERLAGWLRQASRHEGVVLMCHPARPGRHTGDDPIATARGQEFEVLQGPALSHQLQALGLALVRGTGMKP